MLLIFFPTPLFASNVNKTTITSVLFHISVWDLPNKKIILKQLENIIIALGVHH